MQKISDITFNIYITKIQRSAQKQYYNFRDGAMEKYTMFLEKTTSEISIIMRLPKIPSGRPMRVLAVEWTYI